MEPRRLLKASAVTFSKMISSTLAFWISKDSLQEVIACPRMAVVEVSRILYMPAHVKRTNKMIGPIIALFTDRENLTSTASLSKLEPSVNIGASMAAAATFSELANDIPNRVGVAEI